MTNYQGNSHKDQESSPEARPEKPEKKVEKVVTGDVIIQKKGVGRRLKEIVVQMDFPGITRHVIYDRMIPAARYMVADGAVDWIESVIFRNRGDIRRFGHTPPYRSPRFTTYNEPVTRRMSSIGPSAPAVERGSRSLPRREAVADDVIILSSKEEADLVLERMTDLCEKYDGASVADLYDMLGRTPPNSHVATKWGWNSMVDVFVRPMREGWLIDLPQPEPIS